MWGFPGSCSGRCFGAIVESAMLVVTPSNTPHQRITWGLSGILLKGLPGCIYRVLTSMAQMKERPFKRRSSTHVSYSYGAQSLSEGPVRCGRLGLGPYMRTHLRGCSEPPSTSAMRSWGPRTLLCRFFKPRSLI